MSPETVKRKLQIIQTWANVAADGPEKTGCDRATLLRWIVDESLKVLAAIERR